MIYLVEIIHLHGKSQTKAKIQVSMEMNLIMKAALRMRMAAKTNPKLRSVEIISLGSK
jgi:hypothetical protein